ncbi:PRO41 protein [Cladophialophora carrionii]|uniref:PRO41 protein n=1 Tax=Cladophialophora carrionii TaxID=86049 RepID=A0A1C1CN20_9EURO|nr:PRO41 protein [Cladophialophora carrionii]
MGKLIKNHWGRLIVLTAALYQVMAALEGFFWPKIFFDFLTKNLDGAVKPFPVLQIMNLVLGLLGLAWEWPLAPIVKMLPGLHRSMEARLVVYPLSALAAVLMYQSTNAALYYIVGVVVYFWAYSEGENLGLYRRGEVPDLAKYELFTSCAADHFPSVLAFEQSR